MKIYKLSQDINNDYDTYDSCVVIAENKIEAAKISPDSLYTSNDTNRSWASPEYITVEFIGMAKKGSKKGVVCSSFNAG